MTGPETRDEERARVLADVRLSVEAIQRLDHLLSVASPCELREHLLEMYHTYLIHAHNALPINFDKMALNMYLLLNCLREIDEEVRDL
jgi:hypothetical protein